VDGKKVDGPRCCRERILMTFLSSITNNAIYAPSDLFSRFTPNFLLFIPVNKYGLCYICVTWILRTRTLGGRVHPVKKSMRTPSTSVQPDYTPVCQILKVVLSVEISLKC